jgi:hypothetical protein
VHQPSWNRTVVGDPFTFAIPLPRLLGREVASLVALGYIGVGIDIVGRVVGQRPAAWRA